MPAVLPNRRLLLATPVALLWPAARAVEAAPLRLATSELPPMTMPGAPGQRGVLLDLVEELLQRARLPVTVEFLPWARAMAVTRDRPRSLIVPLNRTPERESAFQWLVKLHMQHFVFLTLAGSPRVQNTTQLPELRVAALRGSSSIDTLLQHGARADRIYRAVSISDAHRALQRGIVDAAFGSELIHTDVWRRDGRDPAQLQTGLSLNAAGVWLAASSGITDAELARLQEAHAALLADGSVERCFRRYGVRIRAEDLR